jgi:hypothetical protein
MIIIIIIIIIALSTSNNGWLIYFRLLFLFQRRGWERGRIAPKIEIVISILTHKIQ